MTQCLSVIFTTLFKWMDRYINQDLVAFLVKDYQVFNGPLGRSLRLFAQSAPFQRTSDSIRGFVCPSIHPSVGLSHFIFGGVFAVYGLTAPAQMIKWP